MAHDPTRAWPLGIGPDQTAIPGAAWLELLDGQAFPVVGAGVMVRDGNVWVPASSSNPLHVRAQALEQLIGALNATKETNPDAASASMLALLRGLIAIVGKEATLGQILAALGAPAQESTLVDVLAALTTLAGTIDSGAAKVTLTGRARVVAMGLNEVIPPGVEIFRPAVAEAPVIQAHRRYGFILTFVAIPEEKRRARVNLVLRRLRPDGSKVGSSEYVMATRRDVLVADGSRGTPLSLIMEPVHVPAEWINFSILNTGTEDVTTNWYIVEV